MKKLTLFLLVGICCFLLPVMLLAADGEASALDPVWQELGHYVGVLVAGVLTTLASLVLKQLQEWKLLREETAAQMEAKIQAEAQKIVATAEAWAIKKGRRVGAEDKLKKAVARLMQKFSFLDEDKAEEYVEAALVPLGQGAGKLIQRAPIPAALQ